MMQLRCWRKMHCTKVRDLQQGLRMFSPLHEADSTRITRIEEDMKLIPRGMTRIDKNQYYEQYPAYPFTVPYPN